MIKKKKNKVLIFGTFDGIHKGHLSLFRQAKKYGDHLTVVVARDKTVMKTKDRLPLQNEKERARKIKEYKIADEIKLGCKGNPYRLIQEIKPKAICLGYDQKFFTRNLEKKLKNMGLETKVYRMKPFRPEKYHSSIIRKIIC